MDIILARHAETVFNAAARMQGHMAHTPLTRAGIAQAEAMGAALATALGDAPDRDLWVSPSGRTQQTAAIVGEHLKRPFFDWRTDARLLEIDVGDWEGRYYADIVAEIGPIVDAERRLFSVPAPNGEWFPAIAERLQSWLADLDPARPVLAISHGITARVLRGLLVGGADWHGVKVAVDAPQGTVFHIRDGAEQVLLTGSGVQGVRTA
ncbi:histidine phosphatase family protein [Polymorphobacter fuscus]|uniref:Histidine phosphatase family protein n=1 Tax=Sandarakinorhabdus fusca TaxID=1439888 RepID=A0A7C9GQM8_9SPHN|nr:histidine phosphatase family protein [Polymorphobacter fuscus]KAB7646506.1 histidine phosphatase family protein [Polymorphobacter fuscus]MQT17750.1 histidine phosphatase family protein [Polymorphobacter fuscus]NJC09702.1 putative phosphoglycerate mutase [Polymorphobacter fuscus]